MSQVIGGKKKEKEKNTHLAFSTAPALFWQGFINNVFISAHTAADYFCL